ncbi:hypothetical protein, partial [Bradyrhizobium sp. Mp27]
QRIQRQSRALRLDQEKGPSTPFQRPPYHSALIPGTSNAELNNEQIENENLQLVARRFRETLRPGSKALEALAELVKDTGEIEALARELYYESRPHEDIGKTLKARVEAILRTT